MANPNDTFENPRNGDKVRFLITSQESDGEVLKVQIGVSESTSCRRVGNVKKAFRGVVVSVVRIAVRCDLSVHDSIYKRV
jgi:hypothetical protein